MTSKQAGSCEICDKPGSVHLTEIRDGTKTNRSYCLEHAPPEIRDKLPIGPHRTPAEDVAFLCQQLAGLDQKNLDPSLRAQFKADLERLIEDIEAGRRRLGDPD